MYLLYGDWVLPSRVSPFGHLRIYDHLHLPAAFRSLSRPSSAPGAKAFALRPYSLDRLPLFACFLILLPTIRMSTLPRIAVFSTLYPKSIILFYRFFAVLL